ncbi:uncharacterized protein LOC125583314 [Brassica napus]|uniref:uncharacterized protein LOC125583314 n=1 Tax=Brassica napus TaxID=3708 RepID=UPI00207954FE|nr:uncharacterized protein LOC125583314 [Brassica napus]
MLLPNRRTAHSRFNIPLKLDKDKFCNIKPGTMLAELIEKTDLIIWDETPMTHKHAFEALDKTLKDIMSMKISPAKDQTFGGKTVLLGGDFRQILPVIPQGSRADTVLASISHSYLWNSCHNFSLKTNVRVSQDEKEFSEWLLKVGEGRPELGQEDEDDAYHDQMIIVDNSLVQETKDESLKQVLDAAFGDVNKIKASQSSYTDKAILTPRNDTIDEINAYTISKTDRSQETTTVMIALRFRKLNLIKMIVYTRLSISIPWSFQDCLLINSLSKLGPRLCFCET